MGKWPQFMSRIGFGKSAADIVIQTAEKQDLPHLSQIHGTGFSRQWTDGEFEALLSNDHYTCLTAKKTGSKDGLPLGFLVLKTVLEEAEVISIAVSPKVQNRGIANLLMQAALRQFHADRIKSVFLEVDETNTYAVRLYKKLGFQTVSIRKGYYSDSIGADTVPSDALVMKLELG